jgi:hypothetical protein
MKGKTLVTGLMLTLLVAAILAAAQKPSFSGKWKFDKDRSFSNPSGFDQTMTVTHEGDQVKLEAVVKTARGEQNINEAYTLDGKEADFTPTNPPNAKGKRKATWLPNGRGILINDEISADGKTVSQVARKWTLSADGKTLTVDYFIDDARGSFETKRVFNKVE